MLLATPTPDTALCRRSAVALAVSAQLPRSLPAADLELPSQGRLGRCAGAMLAASSQAHGRGDFGREGARAAAAGMAPHARLSELREEAYCKVLRVFVAQQLYNLVRDTDVPSCYTPRTTCQ